MFLWVKYVLSAVLCTKSGADGIQIMHGSHQRSGHINTATVAWRCPGTDISAMEMVYLMFDLEEDNTGDEELNVEELESMGKVHCLLLPYILPNIPFAN